MAEITYAAGALLAARRRKSIMTIGGVAHVLLSRAALRPAAILLLPLACFGAGALAGCTSGGTTNAPTDANVSDAAASLDGSGEAHPVDGALDAYSGPCTFSPDAYNLSCTTDTDCVTGDRGLLLQPGAVRLRSDRDQPERGGQVHRGRGQDPARIRRGRGSRLRLRRGWRRRVLHWRDVPVRRVLFLPLGGYPRGVCRRRGHVRTACHRVRRTSQKPREPLRLDGCGLGAHFRDRGMSIHASAVRVRAEDPA